MLLRPLFFTSWLIDDFLTDSGLFGASTVVLSSASSKTASALAFLSRRQAGGRGRRADLAAQHRVRALDRRVRPGRGLRGARARSSASVRSTSTWPETRPFATAFTEHYGEQLAHSAVVGATHHDQMGELPDSLPGPRPVFFFAPTQAAKRIEDWGAEGLGQRIAESWRAYVKWTDGWLEVIHGEGPEVLEGAYLDLLDGRIDPAKAHVLSLSR